MSVLMLDLGTTTGFCLKAGSATISGTWKLKGGRYEGGGMRYLRFRGHLAEIHKQAAIKFVGFEEVRRHSGTDAAHVYGGLLATLTSWCEEQEPKVPYEGVPVATIKKHVTGKGNAKKDVMIAAVSDMGFTPIDDNEADAIALMLFKLEDGAVQALV